MKRHSVVFILLGLSAALVATGLSGCVPRTPVPLETIRYDAGHGNGHRLLFVFLPGRGDPATTFERNGLIAAVRERGLAADMIAVNAHVGYYWNGSIVMRLKEDIINPAKTSGYDRIWLVGNSLGGYGSLAYAEEYVDDISGMILLGPFVGDDKLITEIKREGGLQPWSRGVVLTDPREDWGKRFWLWFKDCEQQKACYSKIHLGYGRGDRFSEGQGFLASFLPPEQVIAVDGGHDWSTWKKLWRMFLDKNIVSPSPLP